MMNSDYDKFKAALDDLASRYSLAIESGDAPNYFKRLARYPTETVIKAIASATERYPTFFPTAGQLIEICASVAADGVRLGDAVTLLRGVNDCDHEVNFEPEPEGGLYAGFDVCVHCGRAKPVVKEAGTPVQLKSKPQTEGR